MQRMGHCDDSHLCTWLKSASRLVMSFQVTITLRVHIIYLSTAVHLQADLYAVSEDLSDLDTKDSRTKHQSASKYELPLTSNSKADTKAERKAKSQAGGMHEMSQTSTSRSKASASDLPANQRERSRWGTQCVVCTANSLRDACWAA